MFEVPIETRIIIPFVREAPWVVCHVDVTRPKHCHDVLRESTFETFLWIKLYLICFLSLKRSPCDYNVNGTPPRPSMY